MWEYWKRGWRLLLSQPGRNSKIFEIGSVHIPLTGGHFYFQTPFLCLRNRETDFLKTSQIDKLYLAKYFDLIFDQLVIF